MIIHPAALALLLIALLVSGMGIYAGYYGTRILDRWDPACGSEQQLDDLGLAFLDGAGKRR